MRDADEGASVRDALLFDVRDHEASTDQTLAERRADSWTFAPWLLFVGHIIIAITLLLQDRPPSRMYRSWSPARARPTRKNCPALMSTMVYAPTVTKDRYPKRPTRCFCR